MNNLPKIMTLEEASKYLKQPESSLIEFHKNGSLASIKFGDVYCFKSEDIKKIALKNSKQTKTTSETTGVLLKYFLKPENIIFRDVADKKLILQELVKVISKMPESGDMKSLKTGIFNREALMSTGMGLGIAIPHVRLPSVKNVAMAAAVVHDGVKNYGTLDKIPVNLIFMIIARPDQHAEHLKIVSQLSLKLKDKNTRDALADTSTPDDFLQIIRSEQERMI